MTIDFSEVRRSLEALLADGKNYYDAISHMNKDVYYYDPDHYWSQLSEIDRHTSGELQSRLLKPVGQIANCMSQSSLLIDADQKDLVTWTKSIRASLRLRDYYVWDTEVLHDEDQVLGVKQAGQSDNSPRHPNEARLNFERDISNLFRLIDLLEISPAVAHGELQSNPQATAEYERNTAFVMMRIDNNQPELEDVYNTIKKCFKRFGINAVRADEIEHEDTITNKIREKIKSSEFLLADLTGERPSVYYEVGYAHALDRRVIMYRRKDSKLHFDLAGYNCPEYENNTRLEKLLIGRLEHMTNRKPDSASP